MEEFFKPCSSPSERSSSSSPRRLRGADIIFNFKFCFDDFNYFLKQDYEQVLIFTNF